MISLCALCLSSKKQFTSVSKQHCIKRHAYGEAVPHYMKTSSISKCIFRTERKIKLDHAFVLSPILSTHHITDLSDMEAYIFNYVKTFLPLYKSTLCLIWGIHFHKIYSATIMVWFSVASWITLNRWSVKSYP